MYHLNEMFSFIIADGIASSWSCPILHRGAMGETDSGFVESRFTEARIGTLKASVVVDFPLSPQNSSWGSRVALPQTRGISR